MKNWMLVSGLLLASVGCNASVDSTAGGSAEGIPVAEVPATATHVSIKVPDMECPFACWPKVEKILAAQPGVERVTLSPQQDDNIIDNPQVEVELKPGFDLAAALAALDEGEFHNSIVVAAE